MANDCWNSVSITGDLGTLEKLMEKFNSLENGFLHTGNYYTMFEGDDYKDHDFDSKRLDCSSVEIYEGKIVFDGDSAWTPPLEFYRLLSEEWGVTVDVTYDERGMDFAGHSVFNQGELEIEEEFTYWEYLYLKDNDNFYYEAEDCMSYEDSVDIWMESLNLDKWKTEPQIDTERLKTVWESHND